MMKSLLKYIKAKVYLREEDVDLLQKYFIAEKVSAQTILLKAGAVEHYVYFLSKGIVKGYQNVDGKIVVQHLVAENDLFTSLDSFMTETPSLDYYETVTDCELLKIAKPDFDVLQKETSFWGTLVKEVTNEHLGCKLERVKDFQLLSAKERYLKFLKEHPSLVLHVSVDNIASFLGMEPQSLSRIRKQITI